MKKKILLFGNKQIDNVDKEMIDIINSFDIIVRVNKMDNLIETGNRVDWWWFDFCIIRENFTAINYLSNVTKVMTSWKSIRVLKLFYKLIKNNIEENKLSILKIFFPKLSDNCNVITNKKYQSCSICERNKYWNIDTKTKTIPTTFIIALSHLINEYSDEYDIYITCTDLEGRGELYKTNPIWSNSWHCNVGQYEEDYIKLMMKEGKIKYLDVENHDKDIHNS